MSYLMNEGVINYPSSLQWKESNKLVDLLWIDFHSNDGSCWFWSKPNHLVGTPVVRDLIVSPWVFLLVSVFSLTYPTVMWAKYPLEQNSLLILLFFSPLLLRELRGVFFVSSSFLFVLIASDWSISSQMVDYCFVSTLYTSCTYGDSKMYLCHFLCDFCIVETFLVSIACFTCKYWYDHLFDLCFVYYLSILRVLTIRPIIV